MDQILCADMSRSRNRDVRSESGNPIGESGNQIGESGNPIGEVVRESFQKQEIVKKNLCEAASGADHGNTAVTGTIII